MKVLFRYTVCIHYAKLVGHNLRSICTNSSAHRTCTYVMALLRTKFHVHISKRFIIFHHQIECQGDFILHCHLVTLHSTQILLYEVAYFY